MTTIEEPPFGVALFVLAGEIASIGIEASRRSRPPLSTAAGSSPAVRSLRPICDRRCPSRPRAWLCSVFSTGAPLCIRTIDLVRDPSVLRGSRTLAAAGISVRPRRLVPEDAPVARTPSARRLPHTLWRRTSPDHGRHCMHCSRSRAADVSAPLERVSESLDEPRSQKQATPSVAASPEQAPYRPRIQHQARPTDHRRISRPSPCERGRWTYALCTTPKASIRTSMADPP